MTQRNHLQIMLVVHILLANLSFVRYSLHRKNVLVKCLLPKLPRSAHDIQALVWSAPAILRNQAHILCTEKTDLYLCNTLFLSPKFATVFCLAIGGRQIKEGLDNAVALHISSNSNGHCNQTEMQCLSSSSYASMHDGRHVTGCREYQRRNCSWRLHPRNAVYPL